MAEAKQEQTAQQPPSRSISSRALLQKEFKPKTDRARVGGRECRTHARRAGVARDGGRLRRRHRHDQGDHRGDRQEAHRPGQPDPAQRALPAGRERVARPAPSRQQHRDRRDAQDPRHEHLEEGPRARRSRSTRARPGTRARSSRSSTRRSTVSWAASPTAAWSATTTSTTRRADVELLGQIAQIAAAAHAPFIARRGAVADGHGLVAGARQPARSRQDLLVARLRCLALAARVGRREVRRPGHAALPGAPAVRREDQPGRRVRLRGRDRRSAITAKYTWANAAYAMAVNINRSFKLYGWCSSIRGVESGGAVEGLPVHTFPSDDGGVDMKCPDRDRDQRPSRSGAGQLRDYAPDPSQEHRRRRLHRRAVAAEAGGVHRSGCDCQCPARPRACRICSRAAALRTT